MLLLWGGGGGAVVAREAAVVSVVLFLARVTGIASHCVNTVTVEILSKVFSWETFSSPEIKGIASVDRCIGQSVPEAHYVVISPRVMTFL